jgi:Cdc6-like AAA superfamily ATPase
MHLLQYGENGEFAITSFDDNELPPYAILSHTWGADEEEVTFADIVNGGGTAKPGYEKIRLCGEQARQDRLDYFWIDTCCINKANKAEHSLAIRSMFRWYRNAARCYVYLLDVSAVSLADEGEACAPLRDSAFRECVWFTRGWTLQELLAPSVVEFFSSEWRRLGDRMSLRSQIHEVTNIPHQVLEGAPLSEYSVDERFRWRQHRHTKLVEDAAYSLSGIFDVEIAPVYGEGTEQAFRRLHDKIQEQEESFRKRQECLHDLRATDPRNDKKRIEETKGGLLADSYRWVLDNTAFQQWRQEPHSRLLWVKGDPGKGKTMLLCGIINELQKTATQAVTISYFFCQATDSRINTATAVLRGLLYMLVDQQPSLVSHIRKKHDLAGESLFNDANAWVALTEIWVDVLQDTDLRTTYVIIDALDECVTSLPELLEFVAKQSSASSRVKWIVSSRNWPEIETQLERAEYKVRLSLELNAKSVAAAVAVFIQQKVDQLAQEKQYKADVRHAILQHLKSNADDTFLWVALVCQDLKKTPKWNVLKKLNSFPPGLDPLYERMMDQISKSDGAEICRQVLASTAILYRPMTISELVALVEQLEDLDDLESVREIVGFCGSFLTLREDTVYFVHQSAKDFLLTKASDEIFPDGTGTAHQIIFSKSLAVLSGTLYRDMYSLEAPGYPIEDVKVPETDPLAASRYSCVYWIDHLYESKALKSSVGGQQAADVVDNFLRKKYLYWLEGLSLCNSVGKGVVSMEKLWLLMQVCRTRCTCL